MIVKRVYRVISEESFVCFKVVFNKVNLAVIELERYCIVAKMPDHLQPFVKRIDIRERFPHYFLKQISPSQCSGGLKELADAIASRSPGKDLKIF